jgi:hypothetical protein
MILIKLDPQLPKYVTDKTHYCDPYNHNPEKYTFWTKDNRMSLFTGNIPNTAHWKPPTQKLFNGAILKGVVYESGQWFWKYDMEVQDVK